MWAIPHFSFSSFFSAVFVSAFTSSFTFSALTGSSFTSASTVFSSTFSSSTIPTNLDLFDFASHTRLDPYDLIFNGGEEYEIIATVNPSNLPKVRNIAKKQKVPLIEIGFVEKGIGAYFQNNEEFFKIKDEGWLHFRS